MAKINSCLRTLFMTFNLLFALVGGSIVALTFLFQLVTRNHAVASEFNGRTLGLIGLYLIGFLTMMLSSLGVHGARKESKVSLIVFLVLMCIGLAGLLRAGFPAAVARPHIVEMARDRLSMLVPLDSVSQDVRTEMDAIQTMFNCCGMFGYEDWRQKFPSSCNCDPELDGTCQKISYPESFFLASDQKYVYQQSCFPVLMGYLTMIADISLGVVFGFAALALLAVVLTSVMLYQLGSSSPPRPTMIFSVPAFSAQPPKYKELYNDPDY